MFDQIGKQINALTGKLPLGGNYPTRMFYRGVLGRERNLRKRKFLTNLTAIFAATMVWAHMDNAINLGFPRIKTSIEKLTFPEHLKNFFTIIFTLVNLMVSISQMYLTFEAFRTTKKYTDLQEKNFFKESGLDPELKTVDYNKLFEYIWACVNDKNKRECLNFFLSDEDLNKLISLLESDKDDLENTMISGSDLERTLFILKASRIKENLGETIFENLPTLKGRKAEEFYFTKKEALGFFVTVFGGYFINEV
jgi:hypothetical protein